MDLQPVLAQADNQLGILSVVGADGATLYETPNGAEMHALSPGTALNATGRSADNGWVLVTTTDDEAGWVAVDKVVLFGLSNLPVEFGETAAEGPTAAAQEEAAPTSTPTAPPTPTATPSPTPSPTFTPSPTPPPTVTPTPVPQTRANSSTVMAVVRGGGAALLENPGGAPIEDVRVGSTLTALAVSNDGDWIQARTAAGATGWVESKRVIAFRLDSLPRVAVEVAQPEESAAESAESGAGVTATPSAEEEAGGATASSAASSGGSAVLPEIDTQIRRPAPADTEGKFVATVAMNGSRLNIRSNPGTNSQIIGKALPDEQFIALARTADSAWVQIEIPDLPAGMGWVASQFVELNEPIADLPVSDETPDEAPPAAPQEEAAPSSQPDAAQPNGSQVAGKASAAPGLSGRLVFQTSLGGSIYVYNLATGELRHLTGGGDPAISPDGNMVAFGRFGGDGGVYVINIDGTGERRLWASAEGPRSPKWSPDGKYVLFSRLTGEYPCRYVGFSICVANTPFTRIFPLIRKDERGLSRIDLNGENFRDIPALNTAQAPDWTANGIVYQATTSIEITYDTPDYEGTHIFNEIVGYQDPAWQPNGDRVLYQDKGPDHTEIWSVHPDGSGNRPLTGPLTTLVDQLPSNVSPAWSPDGQHIVYLSSRGPEESEGPWRLWVMDAGGENKRPLPIDLEFVYQHNMEQMVSWGP
ncbi:MAG: SH3 domain-containing protein [Caldilineaceae bacterium]